MSSFVIVTTRDLPEAYFLANELELRDQRVALVNLERRPMKQSLRVMARLTRRRGARYMVDLVLGRVFGPRVLAGANPFPEIGAEAVTRIRSAWPHIDSIDPHGPAVLRFVEAQRPDLMLLAGAPLLKEDLYGIARGGALNRHLALLPEHRGSDCPLWALALNQSEMLGFSIHFVAAKVDAGDIVYREPLPIIPGESLSRYMARLQRTASIAFVEVLERVIAGEPLPRIHQETLGVQFPPAPLSVMRRAVRNYARLSDYVSGTPGRRLITPLQPCCNLQRTVQGAGKGPSASLAPSAAGATYSRYASPATLRAPPRIWTFLSALPVVFSRRGPKNYDGAAAMIDEPSRIIEAYYAAGWTDGLPVVPPTEKSIAEMLASAGLRPDEIIGEIPGRNTVVVAQKVAINTVLAGCRPEYLPVVVAALKGLCHPDFAYHGPASSTGGSAMVLIVNGPIARTLGINAGNNAFGQGHRPNATIGRAVRLVMMNVMNTRPGLLDRATLGTPGKYSFCFAEHEENHPWQPFHVERGFKPDDSTVTVYASNSLCPVYNQLVSVPEPLLTCVADALYHRGSPNVKGFNESLIVFAGEHTEVLRKSGWSRRDVQRFVMEHARQRVADLKRAGRLSGDVTAQDETTWRHAFESPDDLLIVCAGGQAGSWSACLPGWGKKWTRSVTTRIESALA